jgi:thiol:disulfide interchange protein
MGVLLCAALTLGIGFIRTAGDSIVTVYDFTNCYAAAPVAQPCERIAYKAGTLMALFNIWCGVLLLGVAVWFVWELWSAVAPKPVTDDFLKLLNDSFGCDWRRPRSWPWARMAWAYGFTLAGAAVAVCLALLVSAALGSPPPAKQPGVQIETRFKPMQ